MGDKSAQSPRDQASGKLSVILGAIFFGVGLASIAIGLASIAIGLVKRRKFGTD